MFVKAALLLLPLTSIGLTSAYVGHPAPAHKPFPEDYGRVNVTSEHIHGYLASHAEEWKAAADGNKTIEARQFPTLSHLKGGVYFCQQKNWGPACWWQPAVGQCVNKADNVFSIGPDNGINCELFTWANCGENGIHLGNIRKPGSPNEPGKFRSWKCATQELWG